MRQGCRDSVADSSCVDPCSVLQSGYQCGLVFSSSSAVGSLTLDRSTGDDTILLGQRVGEGRGFGQGGVDGTSVSNPTSHDWWPSRIGGRVTLTLTVRGCYLREQYAFGESGQLLRQATLQGARH